MSPDRPLWIDAQLPPSLAPWLGDALGVPAFSAAWLGLRNATDEVIFAAARAANAIVLAKDADFARLLAQHGPPPAVVWLTFGNTSNAHLREVLTGPLRDALAEVARGEPVVEITG